MADEQAPGILSRLTGCLTGPRSTFSPGSAPLVLDPLSRVLGDRRGVCAALSATRLNNNGDIRLRTVCHPGRQERYAYRLGNADQVISTFSGEGHHTNAAAMTLCC